MKDYEIICVILLSCFSIAQAEVISESVPMVIGTKSEISVGAAELFTQSFYENLILRKELREKEALDFDLTTEIGKGINFALEGVRKVFLESGKDPGEIQVIINPIEKQG